MIHFVLTRFKFSKVGIRMEKSGYPPEWTEFSPPPPYNPIAASSSVNNFPVPMIHLPPVGGLNQPAPHSGGTSQSSIPLEQPGTDLLTTVIGHHDRFFLKQTETMGKEMHFCEG